MLGTIGAAGPLSYASPAAALMASPASSIEGADTAKLTLRTQHGELLYEEGTATGTLPGRMRASIDVSNPTLRGTWTIYTHGGSISGRAEAKPEGAGRFQKFRGVLVTTNGTGRYRHVSGRAQLLGVVDRQTFAVEIRTSGNLSY